MHLLDVFWGVALQLPDAPNVKSIFRVGVLGLRLRMNLDSLILDTETWVMLLTIYIVLKQLYPKMIFPHQDM